MSALLEAAKQHWRAKLADGMQCVEVPEWGTPEQPARVWFRPLTLEEEGQILSVDGDAEQLAMYLIVRARDEEGRKLFRKVDRLELMKHVDPQVIARIVGEMRKADAESIEGIEKN